MSGISKIGEDLIKAIISNRPYSSIDDLTSKIKISKPQVINLIKAGAFDSFGNRIKLMKQYAESISDKKQRVTLQNMKMLIDFKLLPKDFDFCCKVFNFNKYLKRISLKLIID
jgi:DNA polymerase III, alpha subunit